MSATSPELSPREVIDVLGNATIPLDAGEHRTEYQASRTPLHVDFGTWPHTAEATPVKGKTELRDPNVFNAVGSLAATNIPAHSKVELHLPVINADGGAKVSEREAGSKAILFTATEKGKYLPRNKLRDVLGDNKIDLEVFEEVRLQFRHDSRTTYPTGSYVTALVLRAKENIFKAVESSRPGHDHLYVNRPFSGEDHKALIIGLGITGIIDREWMDLALDGGMGGVVRTPWAKKIGSLSQ